LSVHHSCRIKCHFAGRACAKGKKSHVLDILDLVSRVCFV
jgi:hypothetical protein